MLLPEPHMKLSLYEHHLRSQELNSGTLDCLLELLRHKTALFKLRDVIFTLKQAITFCIVLVNEKSHQAGGKESLGKNENVADGKEEVPVVANQNKLPPIA